MAKTKKMSEYERPGLRQIETKSRRRQPLDPADSKSIATREAKGWTPQSEPTGVLPVESPR